MKKKINLGVIGATGNVGTRILKILEERNFPIENLYLSASSKSLERKIRYKEKEISIQDIKVFEFSKCDVVIFAAGFKISEEYIPIASKYAICLDNSSFYRMNPDVPLVIPEVNPESILNYKKKNIIANPNCSTSQAVVPLKIIHDLFKLKSVIFSTYQSVSGAGLDAINELIRQSEQNIHKNNNLLDGKIFEQNTEKFGNKRFAFNVIPQIDIFLANNATMEEWKMEEETKKILNINIPIHANCARVPVVIGHSEYINIETEKEIDIEFLTEEFSKSSALKVIERTNENEYAMPFMCAGEDEIFISRIRKNNAVKYGISFWCVADNLRKGAALNNVQILELLINYI